MNRNAAVQAPAFRERPLLFSAPMVRALLASTKTQTRRIVTVPWKGPKRALPFAPYYVEEDGRLLVMDDAGDYHDFATFAAGKFGAPGDRLWVRETWSGPAVGHVQYRADGERLNFLGEPWRWRPSIFMPRWASRIDLEVTGVRVERLQEITEADAKAESAPTRDTCLMDECGQHAREAFRDLWDGINGDRASWESNPWVWVVEFTRIRP